MPAPAFLEQAAADIMQSETLRFAGVIAALNEFQVAALIQSLPGSVGDTTTLFTGLGSNTGSYWQNTLTWGTVGSIAADSGYLARDIFNYDLELGTPITFNLSLQNIQQGATWQSSHGGWIVALAQRDPLYQLAYLYGWNRTSLWQEADYSSEEMRTSDVWQQAKAWMTLASDLERLGGQGVTFSHVNDIASDIGSGSGSGMVTIWQSTTAMLNDVLYGIMPYISSSVSGAQNLWTAVAQYVNNRYQQRALNFLDQFPTPLAVGVPFSGGFYGPGTAAFPIWY